MDGGFVLFAVLLFVVIDEAVCYHETARELDLTVFSLTLIDCIHQGSHFTTFGLGGGKGLSSGSTY